MSASDIQNLKSFGKWKRNAPRLTLSLATSVMCGARQQRLFPREGNPQSNIHL